MITRTIKLILLPLAISLSLMGASLVYANGGNAGGNLGFGRNGNSWGNHRTGGNGNGRGHGRGSGGGGHGGYAAPELDTTAVGAGVAVLAGLLLLDQHRRKEQKAG
ncbi:MAG TPA: hypothetical protein VFB15_03245 [Candidatus Binataceae bacterium]|nr:hypothetical protein [Candidatus Binataceae bacterium]